MDAGASPGPAAVAESKPAAFEVAEEFFPFGVCRGTVFFAGAQFAAAGNECAVPVDGFFWIDGLVPHGGGDAGVSHQELADVRGHPVHDCVGREDPSEIVGFEGERLAGGVGDAGSFQRAGDPAADRRCAERSAVGADVMLEQDGHGRGELAFVDVVGDDERDGAGAVPDAGDDGGEHVGELGRDDQEPFDVALGRGDVQRRDQLPGRGEPVLDQAVMRQLGQLLDTDAFSTGPQLVA